ncbi:MAG: PIN domain-containing protein [Acidobacteria bacterium]|nr:PIN domain-containing protein [Acidobacteriota bacterium]
MKPCLVDVNVWLALLVVSHQHRVIANNWYSRLAPEEAGMCRVVQLALIRLMGNRTVMQQYAVTAAEGWQVIERLLEDERVIYLEEARDIETVMPRLLRYPVPTGKLVNDAYLASFAIAGNLRLVTLDRGFREFSGLDVLVLGD